jgi:hypothetical protein
LAEIVHPKKAIEKLTRIFFHTASLSIPGKALVKTKAAKKDTTGIPTSFNCLSSNLSILFIFLIAKTY